jgi:hypothetical protein
MRLPPPSLKNSPACLFQREANTRSPTAIKTWVNTGRHVKMYAIQGDWMDFGRPPQLVPTIFGSLEVKVFCHPAKGTARRPPTLSTRAIGASLR